MVMHRKNIAAQRRKTRRRKKNEYKNIFAYKFIASACNG